MAKTSSSSQQLEFARLRAFISVGFEHVGANLHLSPNEHPAARADKLWEKSPTMALRGLRAAAADVVEMTKDLDRAQTLAFEERLTTAGAPSLSQMRNRTAASVFLILNRGQIQSDDEWRVINGVLSDVEDRLLDEPTRELAKSILRAYEHPISNSGTGRELKK